MIGKAETQSSSNHKGDHFKGQRNSPPFGCQEHKWETPNLPGPRAACVPHTPGSLSVPGFSLTSVLALYRPARQPTPSAYLLFQRTQSRLQSLLLQKEEEKWGGGRREK